MKIYLCGKMSGLPDLGFTFFDRYRNILNGLGHTVMSPADKDRQKYPNHNFLSGEVPEGFNYTETLLEDLQEISHCDAVYCLPTWGMSKGARAERLFAKAIGKPVYYKIDDIKG